MDKGAHFYRCDFQVHTPRDRNWNGPRPSTDEEKREYAKQFVKACRKQGLQAVAITDHHDLAIFPYIREAAETEQEPVGEALPADRKLVVFPGLELTLPIPCQALVLFDADLPPTLVTAILPALGITPVADSDQLGPQPEPIIHLKSFHDVYERLDQNPYLRSRFIVLPHVQDGAHKTLLRSGFNVHYKEMPCVGGYVDGSIEKLGDGNKRILDGKDANYGNKALAVFQTSDCRHADFSTLGRHSSWVKWARPTAEALRQACLSRHSRILQSEPRLPTVTMRRIEVTDSIFLGSLKLELNPQFNSFIGGRGTGKSSLLEYLRWALCDQPVVVGDEATGDIPNYAIKRDLLIEGTLRSKGAVVTVHCELNGVSHVVKRDSRTGGCQLKIGEASWVNVSEQEVREKIPIQGYSQKQLSSVAVLPNEIQRLVTTEIQSEADAIAIQLRLLSDTIRQAWAKVIRKTNLEAEIARDRAQATSLRAQVDAIRKGLKGLNEEDQKTLSLEPSYSSIETQADKVEQDIESIQQTLQETKEYIESLLVQEALSPDSPEYVATSEAIAEYNRAVGDAVQYLEKANSSFVFSGGRISSKFTAALSRLRLSVTQFMKKYEAAKAKSSSHKSSLQELERLEKTLQGINKGITEKTAVADSLGDPSKALDGMWVTWRDLHRKKSGLVADQCDKLHILSGGDFRARAIRLGNPTPLITALEVAFSRRNIKKAEEKIDAIAKIVVSDPDPLKKWEEVSAELESLASSRGGGTLSPSPILDQAGLSSQNRESLRDGITPEALLDLRLTILEDQPVFEFRAGPDNYISFNQASSGQQATALLKILLSQEGPPLLIDQPEEDLDNEVIQDIAKMIWDTKYKRQLIFASHNANLVVNGDADLVVWFDYVLPEDASQGHIKELGAIDVPAIRDCIEKIMEGGKEAFQLRIQKYGY